MSVEDELRRAHRIRHIGIDLENEDKLVEAESKYDEALALYRQHSTEDDLNYANAVRYPAAIKHRLGKFAESIPLWEEAVDRYRKLGITDGVTEGTRRLKEMRDGE